MIEGYSVIMQGDVELRIAVVDVMDVVLMIVDHKTKTIATIKLPPGVAGNAAKMIESAARLVRNTEGHRVH